MSSPRITFTYQSTTAVDPWWVRLVQLGIEDDTATLADAADLIDTLYSIDACTKDTTAADDPDSDTTDAVVETEVRRVVCSYDDQANIDVQMHIIRSNPSSPYRLDLQGGELKTVETITETTTQTIVIDDTASITLDYPVLGEFSASWAGAVYGASGRITPPIHRNGSTLSFGGTTVKAGTITATYATEYDLATVTILGVDGEPGQCTARGFFHGLVEELELETPEPADELGSCRVLWTMPSNPHQIECYRTVYVSQRCQCSHEELDGYSYEEVVDCPDYVKRCPGVLNECRHYLGTVVAPEYVECPDDMVEAVSAPAYYKSICCEYPSVTLPQCKEQKTSWRGGLGITGGIEQARALYGDDVEIIPVGPPGGICGTWTKRQQVTSKICCDGVAALVWDDANSADLIANGSSERVQVTGGRAPYTWTISGQGFWLPNAKKEMATMTPYIDISANAACGTCIVLVDDGCTTVSGSVRSPNGKFAGVCGVWTSRTLEYGIYDLGYLPVITDSGCSMQRGGSGGVIPVNYVYQGTPVIYVSGTWTSGGWTGSYISNRWMSQAAYWAAVNSLGWPIKLASQYPDPTALPTGPPSGDLNQYSCPGLEPCEWTC